MESSNLTPEELAVLTEQEVLELKIHHRLANRFSRYPEMTEGYRQHEKELLAATMMERYARERHARRKLVDAVKITMEWTRTPDFKYCLGSIMSPMGHLLEALESQPDGAGGVQP